MSVNLFISWSGSLSEKLAEVLRFWFPRALHFTKPFFSQIDIAKGIMSISKLSTELEESNVGIICLTKDNVDKPWILHEVTALSKNSVKANICILLFDLDFKDLTGPLAMFQATKFDKNDFKRLFVTINDKGGEFKLEAEVLNDVFEAWWPKLEIRIEGVLKGYEKVSILPMVYANGFTGLVYLK
jgi:hypothetical protein